jgi:dihydrofolate reductase
MTVLVHRTMSLDGYVASPDHGMDWIFEHAGPDDTAGIIAATGAILAGRRTYEVGRRDAGKPSSGPYGGAWSGPIFVLTNDPEPPDDPSVTFLATDIRDAVATGIEAAGGKKLELFGTDVSVQAFEHDLVDEVLVHIAPVLLGDGIPLYRAERGRRVDLEPVETRTGAVTTLRYRVRRDSRR